MRPSPWIAAGQLASTFTAYVALLAFLNREGARLYAAFAILPFTGLIIRTFVLQHDCGHMSFFATPAANNWVGRALGALTGVPYAAWRAEHNWHHQHQGDLSLRGLDRTNSPMTVAEALAAPAKARLRAKALGVLTVFLYGAWSIELEHKLHRGFFQFRPAYRQPVPNPKALIRSVRGSNLFHALWQVTVLALVGWRPWLEVVVPAYFLAGGVGGMIFFMQHNFERSYQASPDRWEPARIGIEGSSFLRFGQPLDWFMTGIGMHHVHHLNPRIPNYRLDEARRRLPELSAVKPLSWRDLRRCYTHIFWDEQKGRMVPIEEALSPDTSRHASAA